MKNKVIPPLDLNNFFEVNSFNPQDNGSHNMLDGEFKHPILPKEFLGELQGTWFAKHVQTERMARFEMLSQELFRLFLPHQPKTVYGTGINLMGDQVENSGTRENFVLSKKIENLSPLPKGRQLRFFQGIYLHLGHIMALSIFLHEIDLSQENICLDHLSRVVKIDGDWTLASIVNSDRFTAEMNTKIDASLLLDVFFFDHYTVFNWFDIVEARITKDVSEIIPRDIMSSHTFLNEFFEMIICIALYPEAYYKKLIDACVGPIESDTTMQMLMQRKMDLIDSVLQNPKFDEYIRGKKVSEIDIPASIKAHMVDFSLHKDYKLVEKEDQRLFLDSIIDNRDILNRMVMRFQSSPKGIEHSFSGSSIFSSYSSLRLAVSSPKNLPSLIESQGKSWTPTSSAFDEGEEELYPSDLTV